LGLAKSRLSKWIAAAVVVIATLAASHPFWLAALGRYLVRAEPPFQAEIAVVLGGDGFGNRMLKAAELVRQGYVPEVLVSGPPGFYGTHESDLAVPFAVKKGYPESWFVRFPHESHSTREEAGAILSELERRGVRRFILVTSDYHTRRAGRIFRSLAPDREFRVVAAPDVFFEAESWWKSRQGSKQFVFEWMKTLAEWLGL
jgi:uncharacterized SAM-binding protein YcdF (DUF218 family)